MTIVDRISLEFDMADEHFARELYREWSAFCRRCVVDVAEEFFSRYDSRDVYIELDMLQLELGTVSQENFMSEFPVKLRRALERGFSAQLREREIRMLQTDGFAGQRVADTPHVSAAVLERRFANLLYYFEHGFCLTEWNDDSFNLYEELELFKDRSHGERIVQVLVSHRYAMGRLLMQAADAGMYLLHVALFSSQIEQQEKQHCLTLFLEQAPQTVIRYLHRKESVEGGESMAGCMENHHVRRIIGAETEGHAEIELPEYWYRLYCWLLKYYPFNGVPMFGDIRHFRLHMNRSLLSFIHRRVYPAYISKEELTVHFLVEIFGADHYLTILNVIYRNQPLGNDSSPLNGDGYVRELYRVLVKLSLLEDQRAEAESRNGKGKLVPGGAAGTVAHGGRSMAVISGDDMDGKGFAAEATAASRDVQGVTMLDDIAAWLLSPSVSDTAKSQMLRHYARWYPETLWRLIGYASGNIYYGPPAAEGIYHGKISYDKWMSWLGMDDLLEMAEGVSAPFGKTLRQTVSAVKWEYPLSDALLARGVVIFVSVHTEEVLRCLEPHDVVQEYVAVLADSDTAGTAGFGEMSQVVLHVFDSDTGIIPSEDKSETTPVGAEPKSHVGSAVLSAEYAVQPEYMDIENAGLCLMAIWFPRLFDLLGLLTADRKDFKDMTSRIRAVFVLQRLVTDELKAYREQALAFNRILVSCPFRVPLPQMLPLTDNEIRVVDSMLAGVKANWNKMNGTSVKGFQHSFIERPGRLEQRDDRWVLYVESRAYDMLLDSLPWSYSRLRLPWLRKMLVVIWRDNGEEL